MKRHTYILVALMLAVPVIPAFAEKMDHVGCDEMTVEAGKFGIVNEEMLHEKIRKMEESMSEVKRKAARREEHREQLKLHMADMQHAMEELHNMKLMSGCQAASHGASLEARINLIEKRLDMMQTMLQQMLAHQQESERE